MLAVGNDEQQWCEWQQNVMMWTPVDASYHKVWDCSGPNSRLMPLELCNEAAEYEVVGGQCSVVGLCSTGVRAGGCQHVGQGKERVGCGE